MYGSFVLFGALQVFFSLAGHLLVNNTEPPNIPRLTATERISDAARIQDQDATGPRSCPDMAPRGGQRTERTYQLAARDEEEEEQETSLPLDFGDSLPPRLTPLADKQFRYTRKRQHLGTDTSGNVVIQKNLPAKGLCGRCLSV
jgi:hypothetical protein